MPDITDLTKEFKLKAEIDALKKENQELRAKLSLFSVDQLPAEFRDMSNASIIATAQLKILREKALSQELTYDEVKKVTECHKILTAEGSKKKKDPAEELPTDNLLDFISHLDKKNQSND